MNEIYSRQILKHGLLTGAIFLVYIVLLYVFEVNLFNPAFAFLNFLLMVLILLIPMVKSIHTINRTLESAMPFGGKFLSAFLIGFIGFVCYSVIFYLLFQVIDPEYMKGMVADFIVFISEKLESAGLSEQDIESKIAKIIHQTESASNPATVIKTTFMSALLYPAALGVIVAAAVNTKRYHQDKMFIIDETGE